MTSSLGDQRQAYGKNINEEKESVPVDRRGVASSDPASAKTATFERKLGLAEAVGLSLSIVGPTMALAFNACLVVRAAGKAATLVFVIGTVALGIVALSLVSFSKRVAHTSSAYAYIGETFTGERQPRCGVGDSQREIGLEFMVEDTSAKWHSLLGRSYSRTGEPACTVDDPAPALILGSVVGAPPQIGELLRFAAQPNVRTAVEVLPMDQVNVAMEKVRKNKAR